MQEVASIPDAILQWLSKDHHIGILGKGLPFFSYFWENILNDLKYFSWHEIGKFDIPAVIDYILNQTNEKELDYVGMYAIICHDSMQDISWTR